MYIGKAWVKPCIGFGLYERGQYWWQASKSFKGSGPFKLKLGLLAITFRK